MKRGNAVLVSFYAREAHSNDINCVENEGKRLAEDPLPQKAAVGYARTLRVAFAPLRPSVRCGFSGRRERLGAGVPARLDRRRNTLPI